MAEKRSRVHSDLLVGDPRNIVTENNKRSSHPDFATSSELKAMEFSGWRLNSITEVLELWVGGVKRREMVIGTTEEDIKRAYMEEFGLNTDATDSIT